MKIKENIFAKLLLVGVVGWLFWSAGAVSFLGGIIVSIGSGVNSELDKAMIGIKFIIHKISEVFLKV